MLIRLISDNEYWIGLAGAGDNEVCSLPQYVNCLTPSSALGA